MRSSYLIQRLNQPFDGGGLLPGVKDNPFAFGGGYRNGGLTSEAMDLLRPVFSFDYMGSAEFEFGEVPKALSKIAKRADDLTLISFTVAIPLKTVPQPWEDQRRKLPNDIDPKAKAPIYVIAPAEWKDEITARIKVWAKAPFSHLKESTQMDQVLRPPADDKYPTRVGGWLELDNGFFFFADEEMFHKTAALFGIVLEGQKAEPKSRKARISKKKPADWPEKADA
jgi:hypothetical protein